MTAVTPLPHSYVQPRPGFYSTHRRPLSIPIALAPESYFPPPTHNDSPSTSKYFPHNPKPEKILKIRPPRKYYELDRSNVNRSSVNRAVSVKFPDGSTKSPSTNSPGASSSLMKPLSAMGIPGMYIFCRYNQYKKQQEESGKRKSAEKELVQLNHKIDRLLVKLDDHKPELAMSQDEECVICVNARATMQTFPCGHQVVCRKCFVKTIQVAISQRLIPLRCVVCRAKILKTRHTKARRITSSVSQYAMYASSLSSRVAMPMSRSLYSFRPSSSTHPGSRSCSSTHATDHNVHENEKNLKAEECFYNASNSRRTKFSPNRPALIKKVKVTSKNGVKMKGKTLCGKLPQFRIDSYEVYPVEVSPVPRTRRLILREKLLSPQENRLPTINEHGEYNSYEDESSIYEAISNESEKILERFDPVSREKFWEKKFKLISSPSVNKKKLCSPGTIRKKSCSPKINRANLCSPVVSRKNLCSPAANIKKNLSPGTKKKLSSTGLNKKTSGVKEKNELTDDKKKEENTRKDKENFKRAISARNTSKQAPLKKPDNSSTPLEKSNISINNVQINSKTTAEPKPKFQFISKLKKDKITSKNCDLIVSDRLSKPVKITAKENFVNSCSMESKNKKSFGQKSNFKLLSKIKSNMSWKVEETNSGFEIKQKIKLQEEITKKSFSAENIPFLRQSPDNSKVSSTKKYSHEQSLTTCSRFKSNVDDADFSEKMRESSSASSIFSSYSSGSTISSISSICSSGATNSGYSTRSQSSLSTDSQDSREILSSVTESECGDEYEVSDTVSTSSITTTESNESSAASTATYSTDNDTVESISEISTLSISTNKSQNDSTASNFSASSASTIKSCRQLIKNFKNGVIKSKTSSESSINQANNNSSSCNTNDVESFKILKTSSPIFKEKNKSFAHKLVLWGAACQKVIKRNEILGKLDVNLYKNFKKKGNEKEYQFLLENRNKLCPYK